MTRLFGIWAGNGIIFHSSGLNQFCFYTYYLHVCPILHACTLSEMTKIKKFNLKNQQYFQWNCCETYVIAWYFDARETFSHKALVMHFVFSMLSAWINIELPVIRDAMMFMWRVLNDRSARGAYSLVLMASHLQHQYGHYRDVKTEKTDLYLPKPNRGVK